MPYNDNKQEDAVWISWADSVLALPGALLYAAEIGRFATPAILLSREPWRR